MESGESGSRTIMRLSDMDLLGEGSSSKGLDPMNGVDGFLKHLSGDSTEAGYP